MKRVYLYFVFLFSFLYTFAQPVSEDKARKKAVNEYSLLFEKIQDSSLLLSNIVFYNNDSSVPVLYVFNISGQKGFVIISGSTKFKPVLGISNKGSLDIMKLPGNTRFWINGYIQAIEEVINSQEPAGSDILKQWELKDIAKRSYKIKGGVPSFPLIQTQWNQSGHYARYTPDNVYTGCVAVAMSQIMKYYNHPVKGKDSACYVPENYSELCANFQNTTYDWANMPNSLYDAIIADQQIEAVSTLMSHAGVAVEMNYDLSGSSATSADMVKAMKAYFDYSVQAKLISKGNFSEVDWKATIIAELNNARPLYYAGDDGVDGHAFICDGYLLGTDTLFHFNWGWGGMQDGYFDLVDIRFTKNQSIVINLHPNSPEEQRPAPENLMAQYDSANKRIIVSWDRIDSASLAGYTLYVNKTPIVDTLIKDTSFVINNVIRNSIYKIALTAVYNNGNISNEIAIEVETYPSLNLSARLIDSIVSVDWETSVATKELVAFKYDFENFNDGDIINIVDTAGRWKPWQGGISDVFVSTGRACSSSKSLHLSSTSDVLLNFGKQTNGNHILEFDLYVPTDSSAYFNIQRLEPEGVEWALQASLTEDGAIKVRVKNKEHVFHYLQNKWNHFTLRIDLDRDSGMLYMNDTLLIKAPWSVFGYDRLNSQPTFASANFCANNPISLSNFFLDNISYRMETDTLAQFELCRNNIKIAECRLDERSFNDTLKASNNHFYSVKALYKSGKAILSDIVQISYTKKTDTIPLPPPPPPPPPPVNIETKSDYTSLKIYPNPVQKEITIQYEEGFVKDIKLYNALGVLMNAPFIRYSNFSLIKIDLLGCTPGVYYLVITTNEGIVQKKIIKN